MKTATVHNLPMRRDYTEVGTYTGTIAWERDMCPPVELRGVVRFFSPSDMPDTSKMLIDECGNTNVPYCIHIN